MCTTCGTDLAGLRDRALILLAVAVAARRSELASLGDADIAEDPNGLVVELRVSKAKPRTVAVSYGSNPPTCPVRAWKAWKATKTAALLVGPGENAGVVDVGEDLAVTFQGRIAQPPPYVEPYQGAATGVGGIEYGAAFLRIDRHGRVFGPMSGQAVRGVITRAAERAGVATRLTSHSARASLATEARCAGNPHRLRLLGTDPLNAASAFSEATDLAGAA
ncbi:tyrosine-type recombinase/integrase [Catenulispora pinisilvae]|uniref:tyrosine-type recombinase/integrase n=1 Tax=Catenulispora pinisilvae TaxID=2705253 RepID=UPI0018923934|nr:tyrosine-type recombinase/integrase [Catenulispora pinisilvae]